MFHICPLITTKPTCFALCCFDLFKACRYFNQSYIFIWTQGVKVLRVKRQTSQDVEDRLGSERKQMNLNRLLLLLLLGFFYRCSLHIIFT